MAKLIMLAMTVAAGLLIAGCGKEEEYKVEGPTAEGNPSVGAPVSAGSQPGEANAPGTGKGPPPPADGGRGR